MPTLNLGIVAHVDAGKTTLTERLLHERGVTDHPGRVDHGDTTTDADAIERRRGITIRSAVVAFSVPRPDPLGDPLDVHLIDTPGHSDFVAEVERALAVLDGAVLVVSVVEGVQAQTRVLIRILERLGLPFLVFANKIDRTGADCEATMAALREAVTGTVVALTEPVDPGGRRAQVRARSGGDLVADVVDAVSDHDEGLLRRWVTGDPGPTEAEALGALAEQSRSGRAHPVLFGAALGGVGVADVAGALAEYLPSRVGDAEAPLHAAVFKIEHPADGHQVAHVRVHQGTLTARDHVVVYRREAGGAVAELEARVLDVRRYRRGAETVAAPARAGDIATVIGPTVLAIGDQLGRWDAALGGRHFPPPGLESVVRAREPDDHAPLFRALQSLSEQDPLIDARLDGVDEELTVSVYGEVQKEVIAARLASEYGIVADFLPTRTVHVERVAGTGEDHAINAMGNASLGLRVAAAPVGSGLAYGLGPGVERGYLLPSFHTAIEETVTSSLSTGLHGWRLTDLRVTVVHSRFKAPTPSAGEFRRLCALTFRAALALAGTTVCAPVSRFDLEVPADSLTAVLARLVADDARLGPVQAGPTRCRLGGTLPTSAVHDVEQRLPDLTSGLGVFLTEPAGYEPVPGPPPSRLAGFRDRR